MKVTVRFFAMFREQLGTGQATIDLPEGSTARDGFDTALADAPSLRGLAGSVMLMVNEEYVDRDHVLQEDDELAIIPPVSGGEQKAFSVADAELDPPAGQLVEHPYLLDEPEAALSPASQIHFLKLLQRFELEGNAQFIITTHSPILLAYPGAQILSFEPPRIREVAYEQTAHYRLYTQFLLNPAAFMGAGQDESMHPLTV